MKISDIKQALDKVETIVFLLPDGSTIPPHFHVTEVGKVSKDFIDCGGVVRHEEVANFQLWEAGDYDHRLDPKKLLNIIELSQQKLDIGDLNIEVEYQSETIGKYRLSFDGTSFSLVPKLTDCLAKDKCGIPQKTPTIKIVSKNSETSCCTSDSGCC